MSARQEGFWSCFRDLTDTEQQALRSEDVFEGSKFLRAFLGKLDPPAPVTHRFRMERMSSLYVNNFHIGSTVQVLRHKFISIVLFITI